LQLTRKDIESVAFLARLELSEDEMENLAGHINRLLENFGKLQELDTSDIEPTSHVIPVANVFRKDVSRPSLSPDEVTANGPHIAENCFVVPRVVET